MLEARLAEEALIFEMMLILALVVRLVRNAIVGVIH